MLWKAIYSAAPAGTTMGGFDLKDMVTYYFVFQIVFEITWCFIDGHQIIPDIVQGSLTRYLLLPVSYTSYVATNYFGSMWLPRFLSAMVIFPPLMVCFAGDISLHVSLASVVLGIISLALGCVFAYAYHMCVGLAAFWLENRPPFSDLLVMFMGGMIIPIDLMPAWLQHVCAILPFQYRMYLPTKILMGKLTLAEAIPGLAMQALWVLILILIVKMLWRSGLKRYQAYGG
jgi:ABC-2 type transport system permease protein